MEKKIKKLQLNKEVISRLSNTDIILGGEPTVSFYCKTKKCADPSPMTQDCQHGSTPCASETPTMCVSDFTCTPSNNGWTCYTCNNLC